MAILRFRNKDFKFFSEYSINLIYNSIASTFSFTAVNSILGQPLVYSFVQILNDDNELLLTGYILSSGYKISEKPESEVYPGYSISGTIEDCSVPYPLQNDNLSIREIVDRLLKPFGISYIIHSSVAKEMGEAIPESTADDGQTVKDYITSLAMQKGIVLTHDAEGRLVFTKLNPNALKSVAIFKEGVNCTSISLTANGQQMHSEITVVKEASTDNPDAGEFTILNPYVTNRYRPIVRKMDSGSIFDVKKYARLELGKELMGIEVNIETNMFIRPGQIVEVQSDHLKLRQPTRFFITETSIKGTIQGETYTLKCVLPECFSETTVKNVFI
jgi:prophage tail gpP-like protein